MRAAWTSCLLALILAAAAGAQGFEISSYSAPAPASNTPVIADVTWQLTSNTPWGAHTQSLTGKFWRSRDGDTRQDASYGTTFMLIVNPAAKYVVRPHMQTRIWIDHDAKTAALDIGSRSLDARTRPELNIDGYFGTDARTLGEGTIAGHMVIGRRQTMQKSDGRIEGPVIWDIWVDPRLGIPIQFRVKTPDSELFQQLSNIEEREPDPGLFNIPEDYSIVHCKPLGSRPGIFCASYDSHSQ